MAGRTGVLLPLAQHRERRKFGRTTVFDYTSRTNRSTVIEVRELPIVVKLYEATEGQRVYVLSSFGFGTAEKLQPYSPAGEAVYLDAQHNSLILDVAGRYRLELDGTPGSCTVAYEPQLVAERGPQIPQPSGVQNQNGNLLRSNGQSPIIEVIENAWTFTAYGLAAGEWVEVWMTYGTAGREREEPLFRNGTPVILTPETSTVQLDLAGRYRFKLVGSIDNTLLTGNPTPYRAIQNAAPAPNPQPQPGSAYVHTQSTPSTEWIINHNLGFRPAVELLTVGGMEFDAEVVHITANQTRVRNTIPMAGTARLT